MPWCRTELSVTMGRDLVQQGFKRWAQVRFVQQNKRIDTEEARVVRPHAPRNAIAFKQQS